MFCLFFRRYVIFYLKKSHTKTPFRSFLCKKTSVLWLLEDKKKAFILKSVNTMLYRKISKYIETYLKSKEDKILILEGARQIGKSYIIREVVESQ